MPLSSSVGDSIALTAGIYGITLINVYLDKQGDFYVLV